jgi:hypothetical protein
MKKGIGDKVFGWFVVQEEDARVDADADGDADADAGADRDAGAAPTPAPARAPTPARAPAHGPALAPALAPVVAPGQVHDARAFGAVYRAAGVDDVERERLTKVLSLLEALPDEASIEVKRSIVAASLEAFGVSIDRILVTGEGALAALDGYVVSGQNRSKEVLAQAESRIAKLTSEIDEVRRLMDVQLGTQQELARAVTTEKARVRVVLDFFDAGVAGRAVRASESAPRLVRLR